MSTPVELYPDPIPGAIESDNQEFFSRAEPGDKFVASVNQPKLTVYQPSAAKRNGVAVLILPGGGYFGVAIDKEGYAIAERFAKAGVTAFVLKYRMPMDSTMKDKATGPLQDAQQALAVIRQNSEKWGVDADKVGIMGFSAGGHLASTVATHFKKPVMPGLSKKLVRPDFQVLIYPVISMEAGITHQGSRELLLGKAPNGQQVNDFSNEKQVTANTPQAFIVHANDDKSVPVANSLRYHAALVEKRVPVQLLLLPEGGHGFGMTNNFDWFQTLEMWLHSRGIIPDNASASDNSY
ncbi:alpha/beta hydrolase [Alteromonas pelagimontana]|uniref:Alpha/beta hydrolase n=1 Tax=Alteromonas pelagimontana TaxID=1858656 RepID=A0A6M4MBY5_9ALTE|nr:alpha/beta hydrolase [Alteromonas pelagimontana]QJR80702.1 alpha/beta hydrolase [Alteromonas pelagimontana]